MLVDGVDVPLLVERLRPDRAAAVAQDVEREYVGRPLLGLGPQHRDDALHGLAGHALAGADDGHQLVEQALRQRDLVGRAVQCDLVAAYVDVGGEGVLDQREVLVAGTEKADHVDAVGHHNYMLGAGSGLGVCPTACHECPVGRPFAWGMEVSMLRESTDSAVGPLRGQPAEGWRGRWGVATRSRWPVIGPGCAERRQFAATRRGSGLKPGRVARTARRSVRRLAAQPSAARPERQSITGRPDLIRGAARVEPPSPKSAYSARPRG